MRRFSARESAWLGAGLGVAVLGASVATGYAVRLGPREGLLLKRDAPAIHQPLPDLCAFAAGGKITGRSSDRNTASCAWTGQGVRVELRAERQKTLADARTRYRESLPPGATPVPGLGDEAAKGDSLVARRGLIVISVDSEPRQPAVRLATDLMRRLPAT